MSFKVEFSRGPKGRRRAREATVVPDPLPPEPTTAARPRPVEPASIPKIVRMLVLGYHFERLVREGKVKNYAEIARLTGLSRARVTQIVDLTLMAPDAQEAILTLVRSEGQTMSHHLPSGTRGRWLGPYEPGEMIFSSLREIVPQGVCLDG